ncbi:hypothetical protein FIBSPDRAFT_886050 [Athelia psychrophila]|uniref:Uncharacterized protein n=1 Tax=Athelia psychrophila TaxID=1759441 RepID=A0A166REA5_9AGAM|nr:hypothetical protein FIBSPDRAFT_886050 [Fibularhizoctonia sp. CBS 109695]
MGVPGALCGVFEQNVLTSGRIDAPHGTKVISTEARRMVLEESLYTSHITTVQLYCMPCGKYIRLRILRRKREEVFFPQSTGEARREREANGYNNAGRYWMPEECWVDGKVLKRNGPALTSVYLQIIDDNFDEYVQAEDTSCGRSHSGSRNSAVKSGESVKRKRESTSPGSILSSGSGLSELADSGRLGS